MKPTKPYKETFWNFVDKTNSDGCWNWTGYTERDGYGIYRQYRAHRYSLMSTGVNLDGKVVCHKCDNRLCVNPEHLFAGSQSDNVKDMISKNRHHHDRPRKNTPRKVTPEILQEVLTSTLPVTELAKKVQLNRATIYRLIKRSS